MMNDRFKDFLRQARDGVAEWIDNPGIKKLFAKDMNDAEDLWQKYKKRVQKTEKKRKDFLESPKGQEWSRKNRQWENDWEKAHGIGSNEIKWYYSKKKDIKKDIVSPPRPGTQGRPKIPKEIASKPRESPLKKFYLPIKPEAFTINDYRVLLGALHDGISWHEGDNDRYICPDLCKKGTIVDALFWNCIKNEPQYESLIKNIIRRVEQKQAGQSEKDKLPTLTEDEAKVLNYLNEEYPQIRFQQDIVSSCERDRKTIGAILDRLMSYRLVSRPEGKQRGYVITTKGKEYIEDYFGA